MRTPAWPPEPAVRDAARPAPWSPGRGELFLRDTGGDGPPVMLLHGWMASADLNWCGAYDALDDAGYRVLALDHRGHGRGLRPLSRSGWSIAPATPRPRCARSTPRRRSSSATRWAARSPSWSRAIILTWSPGWCSSGTAQHCQDPRRASVWRAMGASGSASRSPPAALLARGLQPRRASASPRARPGRCRADAPLRPATSPRPAASSAASTLGPGSAGQPRRPRCSSPPGTTRSRPASSASSRRRSARPCSRCRSSTSRSRRARRVQPGAAPGARRRSARASAAAAVPRCGSIFARRCAAPGS